MASSGYDWEEPYLFFFNGTYEMEMNVVLDKVHSLHTYLHKAKLPGIGKGEKGLLAEGQALHVWDHTIMQSIEKMVFFCSAC